MEKSKKKVWSRRGIGCLGAIVFFTLLSFIVGTDKAAEALAFAMVLGVVAFFLAKASAKK